MNKVKKRNAIVSAFLVIALLISAAFAFLTAMDTKENIFTVGEVDIELWENFDGTLYGPDDGDPPALSLVAPTQKIEKAPYIVNTGDTEAYVFMEIGVPVEELILQDSNGDFLNDGEPKLSEIFKILDASGEDGYNRTIETIDDKEVDTGWTYVSTKENIIGDDGKAYNYYLYFYNSILEPGEQTTTLFDDIVTANYYTGTKKDVERITFGNGESDFNFRELEDDLTGFEIGPLLGYRFHDALNLSEMDVKDLAVKIKEDEDYVDYFELEVISLTETISNDLHTDAIKLKRQFKSFNSETASNITGTETNAIPYHDRQKTAPELVEIFDDTFGAGNWDTIVVEQTIEINREKLKNDWKADPVATKDALRLDHVPTNEEIVSAVDNMANDYEHNNGFNNFGVLFFNVKNDVYAEPGNSSSDVVIPSGLYNWTVDAEGDVFEMAPFIGASMYGWDIAVDFPKSTDLIGGPSGEERDIPINAYAVQTVVERMVSEEGEVAKYAEDVEEEARPYSAKIEFDGYIDGLFRYGAPIEDLSKFTATGSWFDLGLYYSYGFISEVQGTPADDYQIGIAQTQKYSNEDFKWGNYSNKRVSAINVKKDNTSIDFGEGWVVTLDKGLYLTGEAAIGYSLKADGSDTCILTNTGDYFGNILLVNGKAMDYDDYEICTTGSRRYDDDDDVGMLVVKFKNTSTIPKKGDLITLTSSKESFLTMKPVNEREMGGKKGFGYLGLTDYNGAEEIIFNPNSPTVSITEYEDRVYQCVKSDFTLDDLGSPDKMKLFIPGAQGNDGIYVENYVEREDDVYQFISVGTNTWNGVTYGPGYWMREKYSYSYYQNPTTGEYNYSIAIPRISQYVTGLDHDIECASGTLAEVMATLESMPTVTGKLARTAQDYVKVCDSVSKEDFSLLNYAFDYYQMIDEQGNYVKALSTSMAELYPEYIEEDTIQVWETDAGITAINSIGTNTYNGQTLSDGVYLLRGELPYYKLEPTKIVFGGTQIPINEDIPVADRDITKAVWVRVYDDEDDILDVKMDNWFERVGGSLSEQEMETFEFDWAMDSYHANEVTSALNSITIEGEECYYLMGKDKNGNNLLAEKDRNGNPVVFALTDEQIEEIGENGYTIYTEWNGDVCLYKWNQSGTDVEFVAKAEEDNYDCRTLKINDGSATVFYDIELNRGVVINVPEAGIYNIRCNSHRKGSSYGYAFDRYRRVYLDEGLYIYNPNSDATFEYNYMCNEPHKVVANSKQPISFWQAIKDEYEVIEY